MNRISYKELFFEGFTLAEVLVTLGIIGIIAAMTLPALIGNYQKKKTVNQLKKSYTLLSQAILLSETKNESSKYWNYTLPAKDFYETYLAEFVKLKENTISKSKITYKNLNGTICYETYCTGSSYIVNFIDGSSMIISDYRLFDNGKTVMIDVNSDNAPNQIGKDYFAFAIVPGYGIVAFGHENFGHDYQKFGEYKRENLTDKSNGYSCSKSGTGMWCAALIMLDGWEMKEDYPWK